MSYYIIDYKINSLYKIFRVEADNKIQAEYKLMKYLNRIWFFIENIKVLSVVKVDKKFLDKYKEELEDVERILNSSLV